MKVIVLQKDHEAADPVESTLPVDESYPSKQLVIEAAWRQAMQIVADCKRGSPDTPFPAIQAYVVGDNDMRLFRGCSEGMIVAYGWDCQTKQVVGLIDKA